jgi:hypothetical protein
MIIVLYLINVLGELGNSRFRDSHCMIKGEASIQIQQVFLRYLSLIV